MNTTITLEELMIFIVFLLAIGLGVFLILAIKNIVTILSKINKIVDENEKSIDTILKETPLILENVNKITGDVQETIESVKPSVTSIVKNVDAISEDVTETIDKVTYTVDVIGETIEETVEVLNSNKGTIVNYLNIVLEISGLLKRIFSKK